jgi:hypothetical protein
MVQEAQNCSSTVLPNPGPSTRGSCNCIEATHQFAIQIGDRVALRIPGL